MNRHNTVTAAERPREQASPTRSPTSRSPARRAGAPLTGFAVAAGTLLVTAAVAVLLMAWPRWESPPVPSLLTSALHAPAGQIRIAELDAVDINGQWTVTATGAVRRSDAWQAVTVAGKTAIATAGDTSGRLLSSLPLPTIPQGARWAHIQISEQAVTACWIEGGVTTCS